MIHDCLRYKSYLITSSGAGGMRLVLPFEYKKGKGSDNYIWKLPGNKNYLYKH